MRIAPLLLGLILILPSFAAEAPLPIVPKMTMTLNPEYQNATTKYYDVNVTFNGTVQVDKLPLERIVVALTSQIDTSWASLVSPSSMVITDKNVHEFKCIVTVPANVTANATITVTAKGQGGGFVCVASAECHLSAVSVTVENGTATQGGGKVVPGTKAPFGSKALDWTLVLVGAVAVGAIIAVAAVVYIRRRNRPGY